MPPLSVPAGIQARQISPGHVFYINTTNEAISMKLSHAAFGVLSNESYTDRICLEPYAGELLIDKEG